MKRVFVNILYTRRFRPFLSYYKIINKLDLGVLYGESMSKSFFSFFFLWKTTGQAQLRKVLKRFDSTLDSQTRAFAVQKGLCAVHRKL